MIRRIFARLEQMTDSTYSLLRGSLLLACTMCIASLTLFLASDGLTVGGYQTYKCAQELLALGAVTLLIGCIGSVCVEELTMTKDEGRPRK